MARTKIKTADITAQAVTASEIANTTITASQIAGTTITASQIANTTITNSQINASAAIATSKISGLAASATTDALNASNISSGTLSVDRMGSGTASATKVLYGDGTWKDEPVTDTDGLKDDIALLGFRVAANGSIAKYNLVDQTEDSFIDTSGVDTSASTNDTRNPANYMSGKSGNNTITAFTAAGTFTVDSVTNQISVLVVGGGGGGGSRGSGGGGGAGGLVWIPAYDTAPNTVYAITIGNGGGGGGGTDEGQGGGGDGQDSVFDTGGVTLTITGEAGGAGQVHHGTGGTTGNTGGSGGGGGAQHGGGGATDQDTAFGTYTGVGYGNVGGSANTFSQPGGGGGGASTAGTAGHIGTGATKAAGGAGKEIKIGEVVVFPDHGTNSSNTTTGTRGYFAGGGGGWGSNNDGAANGGVGGGGNNEVVGTANTGGGGGGGDTNQGKAGGSGVVLIRNVMVTENMTLISNSTTAEAVPTKGDIVMTVSNGDGTTTINTDLKAYVSRDNGTTYTQFTLTDQGSTGADGHDIITAHDLDISGQPSGSAMRYKIETLNQGSTKETQIQAVSLGWS